MSSDPCAQRGFANAAALSSDGARGGGVRGGKANQPPAGDIPREDGWKLANTLPDDDHSALLQLAIEDER